MIRMYCRAFVLILASTLMFIVGVRLLQVGLPGMAWLAFMLYAIGFLMALFSIRMQPRRVMCAFCPGEAHTKAFKRVGYAGAPREVHLCRHCAGE